MKVILLKDVKKVGKKDQTVEVSDGYAVNYLFPNKLAVQVTKKSVEVLSNQQEQRRIDDENNRKQAQQTAETLKTITLEFKLKTGKDGKCFGNISLKQIVEELEKQFHITVDKRKFIDKGNLDCLGYHRLKIELYKGVEGVINAHIDSEN